MNCFGKILTGLLLLQPVIVQSQNDTLFNDENSVLKRKELFGFIRGGFYTGIDQNNRNKPYVASVFSDFGLKVEIENRVSFKAFADLRFRYGVEFQKPVNLLDIREAYVKVNGKLWDISLGQKIVKWGRADFTNPTSKLSAQNLVSRSPDREDIDMGNLVSVVKWYPSGYFNIETVIIPFYRSSVLIIDPVPLPENITIKQINSLITNKEMFSYGIKTDFHLKGIDWGISWFDGYDPMPGTALTGFNLDLTGSIPVPATELTITPYKIMLMGLDFETATGNFGIRSEAALSVPYNSYRTNEYVPLPEIKWVAGIDWASGIWRITGEYSGKHIPDFTPSTVDPVIGTEPDYMKIAGMLAVPGFDLESFIRQQVGAFNRLYNYQLKRYYHSAGIRIETDLAYGKLTPSFFSMFNFTSRDLIIIPEIKYKPADDLTIKAGVEFYSGPRGSLYDIVDGFMNSIYVALKMDF